MHDACTRARTPPERERERHTHTHTLTYIYIVAVSLPPLCLLLPMPTFHCPPLPLAYINIFEQSVEDLKKIAWVVFFLRA